MESEANAVEGGTIGAEEEGGGVIGALVVATPTLSKSATTMDESATSELAKAVAAITSATTEMAS